MSSALGLLTYICVNIANIVFFRKYRRAQFNWFLNGVLPGIGLAVCCYVLYKSYGASLWNAGWTYGKSVQIAIVAWLLIGLVYASVRSRTSAAVPAADGIDVAVLTGETA